MSHDDRLPTLSGKERIILELLINSGEMYGLELVKASDGELKRGTVYVTLDRMEDKGLVESRQEDQAEHGGIPRRLYRPTGHGARVLRAIEAFAMAMRGGGEVAS